MRKLLQRLFSLKADLGSLFGGGGNSVQNLAVPTYQTNPTYTQTTQNLAQLSANMLSGQLPSAYSDLGNPNSQQFTNMQNNLVGQTNAASQQNAAAQGTDRSGVAATAAATSLANTLPGLDYNNLLNAQQQQQGLLSLGSGIENTVMNSSLDQQNQQNAFNQQNFQNNLNMDEYNNSYNQMMSQQMGQLIGNVLGGGLGAAAVGMGGGSGSQMLAGGMQGAGMGGGGLTSFFNGMNGVGAAGSAGTDSAFSSMLAGPSIASAGSMSDLAMALPMMCWVASEIYGGWFTPKTVKARYYVNYLAPSWFKRFYLKYGERIARYISDKPILKAIIKPLFDRFVAIVEDVIK